MEKKSQRTNPPKCPGGFDTCLMALNYSWSWLAKLTLQREINEGAGEKMPNDMSAKRPSVTDFMEGLAWDPTPSMPFVGHCEHFGHAFW